MLHFKKDKAAAQPRLLMIAPIAGHYATLLRDTVRGAREPASARLPETALGSAHALGNGNYFFQPGIVNPSQTSNAIQIFPTSGTVNGTIVYNLQAPVSYRAWMMPSFYFPPPF